MYLHALLTMYVVPRLSIDTPPSESELLASPFLTPQDSGMMGRISSSIIRELTSNLLIPHSRLKLLDCVGQGELPLLYHFGILDMSL